MSEENAEELYVATIEELHAKTKELEVEYNELSVKFVDSENIDELNELLDSAKKVFDSVNSEYDGFISSVTDEISAEQKSMIEILESKRIDYSEIIEVIEERINSRKSYMDRLALLKIASWAVEKQYNNSELVERYHEAMNKRNTIITEVEENEEIKKLNAKIKKILDSTKAKVEKIEENRNTIKEKLCDAEFQKIGSPVEDVSHEEFLRLFELATTVKIEKKNKTNIDNGKKNFDMEYTTKGNSTDKYKPSDLNSWLDSTKYMDRLVFFDLNGKFDTNEKNDAMQRRVANWAHTDGLGVMTNGVWKTSKKGKELLRMYHK